MPDLFRRVIEVTIGTALITDLRVEFKIVKSLAMSPNTLDLKVTNLTKATRDKLQPQPGSTVPVLIKAGYENNGQTTSQQIYLGDVRTVTHTRQGPDWQTHLEAGDGEFGLRTARISESFGKGARRADVLKRIFTTMKNSLKVDVADAIKKVGDQDFAGVLRSFALGGNAARELEKVLEPTGYGFSVQDGQLLLIKKTGGTTGEPPVTLSPTSGLIGSPDMGQKGYVRAKSLLMPALKPGREVQIRSALYSGSFRIERVTHEGDSRSRAWYSTIEATPI